MRPSENIRVSEPASQPNVVVRHHRRRRMSGRDPHEAAPGRYPAGAGVRSDVRHVAAPVGVYVGSVFGTYLLPTRTWDGFFCAVVVTTLAVLSAAIGLASAGVSMPLCLLVVTAAPAVVVCGFEF